MLTEYYQPELGEPGLFNEILNPPPPPPLQSEIRPRLGTGTRKLQRVPPINKTPIILYKVYFKRRCICRPVYTLCKEIVCSIENGKFIVSCNLYIFINISNLYLFMLYNLTT